MTIEQRFPQKRVLVTGAASGLGKAIAGQFVARGWRVAFTDVDATGVESTREELRALGKVPLAFLADASDEDAWRRVEQSVIEAWGGLDILVNNAGIGVGGDFERVPLNQWDRALRVNLRGPIIGAHLFVPHFIRQGAGHIVNVASSAGIASLPQMAPYNVTKSALLSFSESLRMELAKHGIGVTCLAPTYFRSNFGRGAYATDPTKPVSAIFSQAKYSADDIASDLMKALESGRFYVITQADGRIVWRLKRLMPERYIKAMTWAHERNLIERFT